MTDWWSILCGGAVFILCLTHLATILGLTGIVWWSFVILFWIVLMSLISFLGKAK